MSALFYLIILLSVLVLIHEFGHFLAARFFGVGVPVFSLGFGPVLLRKTIGDTEFRLSLVPLGGYVQLFGEDSEQNYTVKEREMAFCHKKLWKRSIIVAMGVIFNFLFAIAIFSGISFNYGKMVVYPIVEEFAENSPAKNAGMQINDLILKINDQNIASLNDVAMELSSSKGDISVLVKRNNENLVLRFTPMIIGRNVAGRDMDTRMMGVVFRTESVQLGVLSSMASGIEQTYDICKMNIFGIKNMITGKLAVQENLGGPIMIAKLSDQSAQQGIVVFLNFMAVISACLGIINLLPLPVLDGGHLMFYAIEGVLRRPINKRFIVIMNIVGTFLLFALMFFAIFNDIMNFIIK